ncbi:four helix bundle protein [Fibrobacter sp. UWB4]|uniref:four helix bundle protein n=1 Tax=Fibrobacter sp. UWB4 TaxID=1964356 RepID=UPI000B526BAA|nr:four helix bundle protein [Fibrobacter sp. UWB4]OWV20234.1 four helix bundle protein [Fibrobacter sp. UWB4]
MTQGYRDFVVWQQAMDVAVETYRLTSSFPKEEMFGLTSQMRRAAVSIASNIAEGEGRKSKNEFSHFLGIALGSKSELETQLILSERVNLLKTTDTEPIKKSLDDIGKMLTALRRKIGSQKNLE